MHKNLSVLNDAKDWRWWFEFFSVKTAPVDGILTLGVWGRTLHSNRSNLPRWPLPETKTVTIFNEQIHHPDVFWKNGRPKLFGNKFWRIGTRNKNILEVIGTRNKIILEVIGTRNKNILEVIGTRNKIILEVIGTRNKNILEVIGILNDIPYRALHVDRPGVGAMMHRPDLHFQPASKSIPQSPQSSSSADHQWCSKKGWAQVWI